MMGPVAGIRAMLAMTRRELIGFVRQPSRIIGTIGTPALVWLFLASGFGDSIELGQSHAPDVSYAAFLLPGMVTMVVLFSTVFASISLIQDRHGGFLQSVLVSATPNWAIVGAKVLGGTLVATVQALLLLLAAWLVGLRPDLAGFIQAVVACGLVSVAMVSLGLAVAWPMDSVAGFHGVMNLVLLPMWVLSGAVFPVSGAAGWLSVIVAVNPVAWAHRIIGAGLGAHAQAGPWPWIGTFAFAVAMFLLAAFNLRRHSGSGTGRH